MLNPILSPTKMTCAQTVIQLHHCLTLHSLQLILQHPRKAGLQRSLVALMQRIEGPWKIHSPSAGRIHNHLPPRVLHRSCAPIQQIL